MSGRADQVTIAMNVRVGDKVVKVTNTSPLVLSGDRRRHRGQLRQHYDDVITQVLAALGPNFGTDESPTKK